MSGYVTFDIECGKVTFGEPTKKIIEAKVLASESFEEGVIQLYAETDIDFDSESLDDIEFGGGFIDLGDE